MAQIQQIPLDKLDPNPNRQLDTYPWIESKVATLMRSIDAVGIWESIIARRKPGSEDRFELAFGHHRVEAARRLGWKETPVIVRELSDQQMLEFMGRENGEDYSTDFLVMLNTWEGAEIFLHDHGGGDPIDVARLLGWTRADPTSRLGTRMAEAASACSAASKLIADGHLQRSDLRALSTEKARVIVTHARAKMLRMEKSGSREKALREGKKAIAKGTKDTLQQVREANTRRDRLRAAVDTNAAKAIARAIEKQTTVFEAFGGSLCQILNKTIQGDEIEKRLKDIRHILSSVKTEEDRAVLDQIVVSLNLLSARIRSWRTRLEAKVGG